MAVQRYISTSFWDDAWVQSIDPSEKLLYLYLMTNPLTNIAGIYKITDKRIHDDTGFNVEMINRLMDRFKKAGKAHREGEYIIIPSWPKHQKWREKQTIETGIRKIITELPKSIRDIAKRVGYLYPIDTVPIPYEYSPSYSDTDSDTNSDTDTDKDAIRPVYVPEDSQDPIPEDEEVQAIGGDPAPIRPKSVYNPNDLSGAFETIRGYWNGKPGLPTFNRIFLNLFAEERESFVRMLTHGVDKIKTAVDNYSLVIDDPVRYGFDTRYAYKSLPGFLKAVEKYFDPPREAKQGKPLVENDNSKYDALMRVQE